MLQTLLEYCRFSCSNASACHSWSKSCTDSSAHALSCCCDQMRTTTTATAAVALLMLCALCIYCDNLLIYNQHFVWSVSIISKRGRAARRDCRIVQCYQTSLRTTFAALQDQQVFYWCFMPCNVLTMTPYVLWSTACSSCIRSFLCSRHAETPLNSSSIACILSYKRLYTHAQFSCWLS